MALLYSRPRIKLPKFYCFNKKQNKKNVRAKKLMLILIVFIVSIAAEVKAISPVFNRLCIDKAKNVATLICNKKTTECIKEYNYSDFVIIHTDENKNVKMLEANMVNINKVISDIAQHIQEEINNTQNEDIHISLGSFTGVNLISGMGPKIPVRISTIGSIKTDIKSEFIEKGVNQTLHRLYLEIECEISILTPFNTINEKINNQLIIAENIIVGDIPSNYYNFNGINESDTLNVIE